MLASVLVEMVDFAMSFGGNVGNTDLDHVERYWKARYSIVLREFPLCKCQDQHHDTIRMIKRV